jgi:hypothetical protein
MVSPRQKSSAIETQDKTFSPNGELRLPRGFETRLQKSPGAESVVACGLCGSEPVGIEQKEKRCGRQVKHNA